VTANPHLCGLAPSSGKRDSAAKRACPALLSQGAGLLGFCTSVSATQRGGVSLSAASPDWLALATASRKALGPKTRFAKTAVSSRRARSDSAASAIAIQTRCPSWSLAAEQLSAFSRAENPLAMIRWNPCGAIDAKEEPTMRLQKFTKEQMASLINNGFEIVVDHVAASRPMGMKKQ
jgi:hypothetical protein